MTIPLPIEDIDHLSAAELLALLAAYEEARDARKAGEVLTAVEWATRSPDEVLAAVQTALFFNMTRLARKLATQGAEWFPSHPALQSMADVLQPPVILGTQPTRSRGLGASEDWLSEHAEEYRGQWVAVREGKLVGASANLADLDAAIGMGDAAVSTIVVKVL